MLFIMDIEITWTMDSRQMKYDLCHALVGDQINSIRKNRSGSEAEILLGRILELTMSVGTFL